MKFKRLARKPYVCYMEASLAKPSHALRYQKYVQKVSKSTGPVEPKDIPPTPSAARCHALRTYLQIRPRLGFQDDPSAWGWRKVGITIWPVHTHLPPAPDHLLKVIRCKCVSGCDRGRCSCRRFGLICSAACECSNVCVNHQDPLMSTSV